MKASHAKAIFIWGSVLSSILFLILTYDSLSQLPHRTHEENLNEQVAAGKWVWQKYNCNDCHTILGIGGYYAPDVTRVMSSRDADWMKKFLKDPGAVWPADRKMPKLHLKDQEIGEVISFLTWVNGIDTNNWPPRPLVVAADVSVKPGADIFKRQGCSACHMIGGVGGAVGPDLTKVGSRRDKEWIEEQLTSPKAHNPNSIMPSYAKLPEQDRKDLAEYLWGLK